MGKKFDTQKRETIKSRINRIKFNIFPAYRRTGGRLCFLSEDWREIHVKLEKNWATRNFVGSVFGGSIYGALDPIYMIQLLHILGKEYVVWDKAANIKFIKPVKNTVYAKFLITEDLISQIKNEVKEKGEYTFDVPANFVDKSGEVYSKVMKTMYVAEKDFYKKKNE